MSGVAVTPLLLLLLLRDNMMKYEWILLTAFQNVGQFYSDFFMEKFRDFFSPPK